MKTFYTESKNIITLIILLFHLISFAQPQKKETKLARHLDVVTLLQEVKISASSLQSYAKDWDGEDLKQMKSLYYKLQVADGKLIARYGIIINNYQKAKKQKMSIDTEMTALQTANNEFVTYYFEHSKNHPNKEGIGIWGDIIKIVFDAGKQIYDFVDGITKAQRDKYLADLKDKSIPNWGETVAKPISQQSQKE